MKSTRTLDLEKLIRKSQQNAYLHSKNVPIKKPFQLELLFPSLKGRNDLRHIPNDYARSSLFTTTNRNRKRRHLMRETLFHYNSHIRIVYTGIELRAADDEIVWMQILSYGIAVPLGEPFEFSIKELINDLNLTRSGQTYENVRACISRLKANEVLAENTKAYGISGTISLIQNYVSVNDRDGKPTRFKVWLDPSLIYLMAGDTFTSHKWSLYKKLSPVARRLADYVQSHKHPYPLDILKFRGMCGSAEKNTPRWRQTVRKACLEIENSQIATIAKLTECDQIVFVRDAE